MKKRLAFLFSLMLMLFCFPLFNNNERVVEAAVGTAPSAKYSSTLSSTYYNGVEGKTGDALLEGLASLTLTNHKYYTTYEELKGGNALSDKDPNNSNKLIDFYTGWSIPNDWDGGATWNREHVWAQSRSNGLFGESGAGSDIHHIRPLISSLNSARNNALFTDTEHCGSITLSKYYYNGTKVPEHTGDWTGCYNYGQEYWEPRDNEKGDVARILMYVYMHYSKEVSANSSNGKAGDLYIQNIAYTSKKTADAAFDMLVEWNDLDPVSSFESNRNNYCASVTGARNPFIDHPEYANAIWGDGSNSGSSGGSSSGGSNSGSSSGSGGSSSGGTTTETITTTTYKQLKSANGITVGSKIIIAAKDYNYALSTNQKTNNRGQSSISKYTSGSDAYLTPSSNTQILEVKAKDSSTGGYSLYTGSGYLAATSSEENLLTTKTSVGSGKNAYWKINFSSGAAKIVSAGSYTRNTIRYNPSSSLFSCYDEDNTQKDVAIYKQYVETTTVVVPTPDTGGSTPSYEYPSANSLLSIDKAIEVANAAGTSFTSDKYKIQGTITAVENDTYGNVTVTDDNGDSIYVYGLYNNDGTTRYDAMDPKPNVGDKVTLLGILGIYNSSPEMKYAWVIEHEVPHTHQVEITYDSDNHYEVCSGCDETLSSAPHSYTKTITQPNCLNEGYTTFVCDCGYSYVGDYKNALNHSYEAPTYVWNSDYTKCTATRVCKNDSSHKETETVNATVTRSEASCGVAGSIVYTASFTNEAFKTQIHSESIEALTHDYQSPTYTWNADHTKCTAERVCKYDSSHKETEIVTASKTTVNAECGKAGSITYSASFQNSGFKTQTYVESIEALSHQYNEPTYSWSNDYTMCTAERVCKHNSSHKETETIIASITTKSASCESTGSITYSASFVNSAFKTQIHVETINSIGHKYQAPTYSWSNDYTMCTATRVCQNDASHKETETVTANVTKVDATCESSGSITYTATFIDSAFKTQIHSESIDPLNHEYGTPTYSWNADHTKCTASRVCINDGTHIETETVNSATSIKPSTCESSGSITYIASFSNSAFKTQEYTESIDPLNHNYGAVTYSWNSDYTMCTATRVCKNDSSHKETETVSASVAIVDATCESSGSITYTATFINSAFKTQTHSECIEALSHKYGEPTYTWNSDHSKCTATIVCSNDNAHIISETAEAEVSIIEATCEEEGSATYVVLFDNPLFETQTYVEVLEEKGHEYNEGVITKEATEDEEGEITYTCSNCGHSYAEEIEKLPPSVTEPPLDEEDIEAPNIPGETPDFDDSNTEQSNVDAAVVTTVITASTVSLSGVLWFVFKCLIKIK